MKSDVRMAEEYGRALRSRQQQLPCVGKPELQHDAGEKIVRCPWGNMGSGPSARDAGRVYPSPLVRRGSFRSAPSTGDRRRGGDPVRRIARRLGAGEPRRCTDAVPQTALRCFAASAGGGPVFAPSNLRPGDTYGAWVGPWVGWG